MLHKKNQGEISTPDRIRSTFVPPRSTLSLFTDFVLPSCLYGKILPGTSTLRLAGGLKFSLFGDENGRSRKKLLKFPQISKKILAISGKMCYTYPYRPARSALPTPEAASDLHPQGGTSECPRLLPIRSTPMGTISS